MSGSTFASSRDHPVTFDECMYVNLCDAHFGSSQPQRLSYSNLPKKSNDRTVYRLVCISDTHNEHENLVLPPGDLLIHSGDILTESGHRHTKEVEFIADPRMTNNPASTSSGWSWFCKAKQKETQDNTHITDQETHIATTRKKMNVRAGDELVDNFLQWFGKQSYPHKVLIGGNHDLCLQNIGKGRVRNTLERYSNGTAMYLEHEAAQIGKVKIFGSPFAHYPSNNRAFRKEMDELQALDYSDLKNANIFLTHMPLVLPHDDGSISHCDPLSLKLQKYHNRMLHIAGHCHWAHGLYRTKYGIPSIVASISSAKWLRGADLIGNQQGSRGDKSDSHYGGYNLWFPPWVVDIEIEQGIPTSQEKWSLIFSNSRTNLQPTSSQIHSQEDQKEQSSPPASSSTVVTESTSNLPTLLLFAPEDHQELVDRVVPQLKAHFQVYHFQHASDILELLVKNPNIRFDYCLSKLGTKENKASDFLQELRKHGQSSKCKIVIHSATAASNSSTRRSMDDKYVIHQFIHENNEKQWLQQLLEERVISRC